MISHASQVANDSSSVSDIQVWQVLSTDACTMHRRPCTATAAFVAMVWAENWAEISYPHSLGGMRNHHNFADQILRSVNLATQYSPVHDAEYRKF